MNWYFIDSGFLTGEQNMKLDFELAKKCLPKEAFFRLYRWKPFAISLGKNQSLEEIDIQKVISDGLDIVKRPTGGRAILHAEEITYSVVVPSNIGFGARELYKKISDALLLGLKFYDSSLSPAELESIQPNFMEELNKRSGGICFASTAKNEIKFEGRKLIGSAQRKLNDSILQHGSILCGTVHRNLPDYFYLDDVTKKILKAEMTTKTIELESILSKPTDYKGLTDALRQGFQQEFKVRLINREEFKCYA